jgi:hypothetical protein
MSGACGTHGRRGKFRIGEDLKKTVWKIRPLMVYNIIELYDKDM